MVVPLHSSFAPLADTPQNVAVSVPTQDNDEWHQSPLELPEASKAFLAAYKRSHSFDTPLSGWILGTMPSGAGMIITPQRRAEFPLCIQSGTSLAHQLRNTARLSYRLY